MTSLPGSRVGPRRALPLRSIPAHPPPFPLTAAHFATALVWLAAGAAGLVAVAPTLARGGYLDPRVLGVVHMFTLGVITTTIFGALYQMLPPLLGVSIRSVRLAAVGFACLTLGAISLVAGLWTSAGRWQGAGWGLIAVAIVCVSATLLPQRRKAAAPGRTTGLYISAGHSALGFAFVIAGARIGERLGWWQLERLGMLAAHFHLAALGFATLTAVGVSSRILPMFLGAERTPHWPLRWIGPVAGAGLVVFAIGQMLHWRRATLAGSGLMAAAMAGYLGLVLTYFASRTRPLDPALGHIAAAYVGLAASVILGLTLPWAEGPALQRGAAAYVAMAILGWLVLLILGVFFRVVPFLTWLNLGRAATAGRDPAGLMPRRMAWGSLLLLAGGVWVMVAAIWLGSGMVARIGAAVFAGGVVVLLGQYVRLVGVVRRSAG